MKKSLFSVLLAITALQSVAQISITDADMPIAGDSTVRVTATNATGLDFVATGANQVWDFSTLNFTTSTTDNYFAIGSAPIFTQLVFNSPLNANSKSQIFSNTASPIAIPAVPGVGGIIDVNSTNVFYKKVAARYARTGYSLKLNGFDLPLPYDSNDVIYKLPMTFGGADSSLSVFEIDNPLLSFLYYKQRQKRVNHIDGWGKLKLPNGFDYDVLRVKSEIYATDTLHIDTTISIGGFPVPINQGFAIPRPKSIEYKWLTKNKQAAILEVIGTENAGIFTPTTVRYYNQFAVGISNVTKNNFEIYPTMATNNLYSNGISNITALQIIDMNGKLISTYKPSTTIDISSLVAGRYFVVATYNDNSVVTKVFVK